MFKYKQKHILKYIHMEVQYVRMLCNNFLMKTRKRTEAIENHDWPNLDSILALFQCCKKI